MLKPSRRKNLSAQIRFDQRLVLFSWILKLFEVQDLKTFAEGLNGERFEGFDPEGRSYFYYNLRSLIGRITLSNEELERYDENIVRHWKRITEKRNREAGVLASLRQATSIPTSCYGFSMEKRSE